jgi:hypothetical protein
MERKTIMHEFGEIERSLTTPHSMLTCPYLRTGTEPCVSGCWSEPRCITDEPMGGWESDARENAYSCATWARDLAYEARGHHGLVKHARDLARWAEKVTLRGTP